MTAQDLKKKAEELKQFADRSTDACLIAQSIAFMNSKVRDLFLDKLKEGHQFKGASCLGGIGIPEQRRVLFRFECADDVICLIPPSFLVIVDIIDGEVEKIRDPYYAPGNDAPALPLPKPILPHAIDTSGINRAPCCGDLPTAATAMLIEESAATETTEGASYHDWIAYLVHQEAMCVLGDPVPTKQSDFLKSYMGDVIFPGIPVPGPFPTWSEFLKYRFDKVFLECLCIKARKPIPKNYFSGANLQKTWMAFVNYCADNPVAVKDCETRVYRCQG